MSSALRKAFELVTLTSNDLDKNIDDIPRKVLEKEPDTLAANWTGSEIYTYEGHRYSVSFFKNQTPDYKDVKFGLGEKYPTEEFFKKELKNDLYKNEDKQLIQFLDAISKYNNIEVHNNFDFSKVEESYKSLNKEVYYYTIVLINRSHFKDVIDLGPRVTYIFFEGDYNQDIVYLFPIDFGQILQLQKPTVFHYENEYYTYSSIGLGVKDISSLKKFEFKS